MKIILITALLACGVVYGEALTISEVMSDPVGTDSGREWIELYNDTASEIDLSTMTVSIKGGTAIATTPLQGGLTLPANGYAVIASVVSGQTKFLQDYPSYAGPLFKSSISLVNTGVTSIDIKLNGPTVASLPSYTAAKEGTTLSYIGGSYVAGIPTPGADNQVSETPLPTTNATTTDTQVTLPQMSPPTADIIIYMPTEKVVVAGAESEFAVFSQTRAGKSINDLHYAWAFGDGGQGTGSSTKYRYAYSGRYIAQVEATSATVAGTGRMVVRVVPPEITISAVGSGKYGNYIEIRNPNTYDLDLSQWRLTIDGVPFPFPKNTFLSAGASTRFSGLAMGFASTTMVTSTVVKILFPSLEEVTRYIPPAMETATPPQFVKASTTPLRTALHPQPKMVLGASSSTEVLSTNKSSVRTASKDTRIVSWFRSLFSRR